MPSSISFFCPFLLNFTKVATLGVGNFLDVNFLMTSGVFFPDTLITATPEIPGPDDNASGTSGLLEIARILSNESPNIRVDLVAYTLEEPPFFRKFQMGSSINQNCLEITL